MEFYGMTGERLGIIGQPDEPEPVKEEQPLPEWKKAFLPTWSASVRKGIAKNYATPYEDTSTLVLTSPSGKFVDIRFPLTSATRPSTTEAGIEHDHDLLSSHPSFWAFTGTVKISFLEPASITHEGGDLSRSGTRADAVALPYSCHAIFEHEIDSKGPGITDEGDMFVLPNGDSMEVGFWTDPSSGQWEMYKEYWTEASAPGPNPSPGLGLTSSSVHRSTSQTTHTIPPKLVKKPCVVLETKGQAGNGMVIAIGAYCQGVLQRGGSDALSVTVVVDRWEAWQVMSANGEARQEWVRDPRSSAEPGELPCEDVVRDLGQYRVGSKVVSGRDGQLEWTVVEVLV